MCIVETDDKDHLDESQIFLMATKDERLMQQTFMEMQEHLDNCDDCSEKFFQQCKALQEQLRPSGELNSNNRIQQQSLFSADEASIIGRESYGPATFFTAIEATSGRYATDYGEITGGNQRRSSSNTPYANNTSQTSYGAQTPSSSQYASAA